MSRWIVPLKDVDAHCKIYRLVLGTCHISINLHQLLLRELMFRVPRNDKLWVLGFSHYALFRVPTSLVTMKTKGIISMNQMHKLLIILYSTACIFICDSSTRLACSWRWMHQVHVTHRENWVFTLMLKIRIKTVALLSLLPRKGIKPRRQHTSIFLLDARCLNSILLSRRLLCMELRV